jgi:predicted AAA+ superfamily ATPase
MKWGQVKLRGNWSDSSVEERGKLFLANHKSPFTFCQEPVFLEMEKTLSIYSPMPHQRTRYLTPMIKKGLTFKGIVGIFGHRQVGKTTLLEMLARRYATLDRTTELSQASENPAGFLHDLAKDSPKNPLAPIAIDECQLCPPLFPELKEWVRVHPNPGIFLLSGSVRFSSRKAIRESLTGRILTYELLPFSISELQQTPMNRLALELLTANFRSFDFNPVLMRNFGKNSRAVFDKKASQARKYLETGGLPGICFVRNERDRKQLFESQLNLILDRDLRLVCDTQLSFLRLRVLVRLLAENQNRPLNLAELARKSRISTPTLTKILIGLEAIFFMRQIPCEGSESRPTYFLEDQGEATFLNEGGFDSMSDFERLAYSQLRVPFFYTPGLNFECFQYRQQGGALVQLAFRASGRVIGFLCSLDEKPSLGCIRSGMSFRKTYPGSKVIYLHPGSSQKPTVTVLNEDEVSLPIQAFF